MKNEAILVTRKLEASLFEMKCCHRVEDQQESLWTLFRFRTDTDLRNKISRCIKITLICIKICYRVVDKFVGMKRKHAARMHFVDRVYKIVVLRLRDHYMTIISHAVKVLSDI